MKRSLLDRAAWAVAGALAVALIASLAGVARGGQLDPPGPPASTLPLVEPRTPIRQPASAAGFPIVISAPGSYYLAENITGVVGKDGIEVRADSVTIDLNGFALTGVPGSGHGIWASDFVLLRALSIGHGAVQDWGADGINGDNAHDGSYDDLRLDHNAGGGIRASGNSLISHVVAAANGAHGILMNNWAGEGGIIRDSTASLNDLDGIVVLGNTLVVDNNSFSNGDSAIHAYYSGSRIDSNNVSGAGTMPAIHVEGSNNVIVRNSIRGVTANVSIAAMNTVGPLENAFTPFSHPWANIVY